MGPRRIGRRRPVLLPLPGACPAMASLPCRSANRCRSSLASRCQAHHFERRASEKAVGVAESLGQFKMVVVLADEEPHPLAGGLDHGGEFSVLALEFGGLAGAVGDDQLRL